MFEHKFCFAHWLFHYLNTSTEACETLAAILPCNSFFVFTGGLILSSPSTVKTHGGKKGNKKTFVASANSQF